MSQKNQTALSMYIFEFIYLFWPVSPVSDEQTLFSDELNKTSTILGEKNSTAWADKLKVIKNVVFTEKNAWGLRKKQLKIK